MAQRGQKDLLARLADAGEEALTRLASTPGADRVMGVMTNLRDQVDALSQKVRGIESLEQRIDALEREVERLKRSNAGSASRKTTAASKKTSTSKRSTTKKS